jgi:hypothetical protein
MLDQILIGTTSSGILNQLGYIYTPYGDAVGMSIHINGKFTMGSVKLSLLS